MSLTSVTIDLSPDDIGLISEVSSFVNDMPSLVATRALMEQDREFSRNKFMGAASYTVTFADSMILAGTFATALSKAVDSQRHLVREQGTVDNIRRMFELTDRILSAHLEQVKDI